LFEGFKIAIPMLFIAFGTMLVGGSFLIAAWVNQRKCPPGKPRRALYAFTTSVLVDTILILYSPSATWELTHHDLWTFFSISMLITSFALLFITVALTLRSPGILKVGARVLFVMNLLGFVWLIYGAMN